MHLPAELLVSGKLILLIQAAGRVSGRNTKTDFKAKVQTLMSPKSNHSSTTYS